MKTQLNLILCLTNLFDVSEFVVDAENGCCEEQELRYNSAVPGGDNMLFADKERCESEGDRRQETANRYEIFCSTGTHV